MPCCSGTDRGCEITLRETGQTSTWSLGARTVGKPASRSRADDGGMSAGAASPNGHPPKGVLAPNQVPHRSWEATTGSPVVTDGL